MKLKETFHLESKPATLTVLQWAQTQSKTLDILSFPKILLPT